jgi:hypothetical protein
MIIRKLYEEMWFINQMVLGVGLSMNEWDERNGAN